MNKHSFIFLYTKPFISAFVYISIFCLVIFFIIFDNKYKVESKEKVELAQKEENISNIKIKDEINLKDIMNESVKDTNITQETIYMEMESQKNKNIQYKVKIVLNIREKASVDSIIVGSIKPENIVTQVEERGNWIRIDKGWIFKGKNVELVE